MAGLPGLPPDDGSRYSVRRLTVAWNLDSWGNSRHTAIAHRRDLSTYLDWCASASAWTRSTPGRPT
ncbi:hypothetical protein I0C86_42575 [Plantactinospora sp. S1510]|uniref:Core-binding (CB) domain-containing protein n=1 Tax=Plantactinospora alkalitolerans TaxID=2789879 RepID=A0ABS0HBL8_9ACTN|nr:hypothetical protein [Plantactinospora alkalitolerans]MBF9135534.1 hypothetical protein [Plantactinospora alkalitolerans]